jgi:hypothetical protein
MHNLSLQLTKEYDLNIFDWTLFGASVGATRLLICKFDTHYDKKGSKLLQVHHFSVFRI